MRTKNSLEEATLLNLPRLGALLESHCHHLAIGQPSIRELNHATGLANLTPGDFANVARQHRLRNFTSSADFIAALEDECRMKEGGSARAVGFF